MTSKQGTENKIPDFDPFDTAPVRAADMVDVEVAQVLTAVPVRKPKRDEFVRVHPEFVTDKVVLEHEDGRDRISYLVAPGVEHLVVENTRLTRLFVAITKRKLVFLWPVKLPQEGNDIGRRVAETALIAADQAKTLWVKTAWNRDLGGYDLSVAKGDLGEPQWPDLSFRELLTKAFRANVIDSADHSVIREILGEL